MPTAFSSDANRVAIVRALEDSPSIDAAASGGGGAALCPPMLAVSTAASGAETFAAATATDTLCDVLASTLFMTTMSAPANCDDLKSVSSTADDISSLASTTVMM